MRGKERCREGHYSTCINKHVNNQSVDVRGFLTFVVLSCLGLVRQTTTDGVGSCHRPCFVCELIATLYPFLVPHYVRRTRNTVIP